MTVGGFIANCNGIGVNISSQGNNNIMSVSLKNT